MTLKKEFIGGILNDIRFWIVLFFIIRLIGIQNPPLEAGHNWRQCLTLMISRNFYEDGLQLFYPKIDMAGNLSGIIGSEFPLFNMLIYFCFKILGYAHWYGRLINLVVSSFGIYSFYLIVSRIANRQHAFYSTLILLSSIWFAFSRKTMPDTFSISLMLIALNFCANYLVRGKLVMLLLFFLFSILGLLCKIPALSLLSILPVLLFVKGIEMRRILSVYSAALISVLCMSIWYFIWVPHLVNIYHFPLYFPKGLKEGFMEVVACIIPFLEKFYFSALESYIAFAVFLFGVYYFIKNESMPVKSGITIITVVFFLFILKTGNTFPMHSYYIIPYVPVMAFLCGYFLRFIPSKYSIILIVCISIEAIANQQHDFFIKKNELYKLTLERITSERIPKDNLIIINGGYSNPQMMYFSHCRGWTVDQGGVANKQEIETYRSLGAKYLIIDKTKLNYSTILYRKIFEDENFIIFDLR